MEMERNEMINERTTSISGVVCSAFQLDKHIFFFFFWRIVWASLAVRIYIPTKYYVWGRRNARMILQFYFGVREVALGSAKNIPIYKWA